MNGTNYCERNMQARTIHNILIIRIILIMKHFLINLKSTLAL